MFIESKDRKRKDTPSVLTGDEIVPKVMVVDDEADVIRLVGAKLRREGYEVAHALSGRECLKRIRKEKPDLLLLDIMMPEMDGNEVCRRIKQDPQTEKIIVVMFTVNVSGDTVKESLECQANAYIDKPIALENLVKIIERLLGG